MRMMKIIVTFLFILNEKVQNQRTKMESVKGAVNLFSITQLRPLLNNCESQLKRPMVGVGKKNNR